MWQLILFRGIQGLGAGALFPIALATIGDLFTPAERGKYQGLFGAVFGVAFLVGPALGGFLTDHLSWHWIFFVNIPIGLVALVVIARLLPNIKGRDRDPSIDYLGVVTLTACLVPILVGLTVAETSTWTDPWVWGMVLVGAIFLGVFVFVENRAKEPIIPLHLFRNRTFSASMVSIFFATFGFGAAIIFLPLYFQVVGGATRDRVGLQAAAVPARPDRLVDRAPARSSAGPGKYRVAGAHRAGAAGHRAVPDDQPASRHARPDAVGSGC